MTVTDRKRRQRARIVFGRYPDTISTGRTQCHTGAINKTPPPGGPRRGLTPFQGDVLAVLAISPRSLRELAEAVGCDEWSRAGQAADQLCNRGLAELVPDAAVRPTWKAVKGATEGNPPEA